jgi:hypothetical protein
MLARSKQNERTGHVSKTWALELRKIADAWRADADRMQATARELAASDDTYTRASERIARLADEMDSAPGHGSTATSCAGELSACVHNRARHELAMGGARHAAPAIGSKVREDTAPPYIGRHRELQASAGAIGRALDDPVRDDPAANWQDGPCGDR